MPVFWRPEGKSAEGSMADALGSGAAVARCETISALAAYDRDRARTPAHVQASILALKWDQVDWASGILSRLPRGAPQDAKNKKRSPPVRIGWRIEAHLRRWQRLDGAIEYICHLDGQPVVDPHTSWRKAVAAAGLEGVTPHTLRHTRATWMMRAKVPIWEAAGFLGMTTKTLERVYGHHSPEWQERAANI